MKFTIFLLIAIFKGLSLSCPFLSCLVFKESLKYICHSVPLLFHEFFMANLDRERGEREERETLYTCFCKEILSFQANCHSCAGDNCRFPVNDALA